MRVLQLALTALASLLLGGDEQSPRLEKTTKQPLPSSPGSCALWLPASREAEAKLLWQWLLELLSTPGHALAPRCAPGALVLLSGVLGLHPVSLYHAKNILISKGSQVSPSLGRGVSVFFWPKQRPFSNMWGPLSF